MSSIESSETVKFLDLAWQTAQVKVDVAVGWETELMASSFILSSSVQDFEADFAQFLAVGFCAGVGNGTDALEIALRALGVGSGDEVIVPANSFVASAIAATRCGAIPVFVDCSAGTWLIDVSKIEAAITSKTRVIMPVHLYGQMADMAKVLDIAARFGLHVVEDVAQAQGASQNGQFAGSLGHASGTSFYPGKNLGAMGDAGAVLTPSQHVFEKVLALRNYGSPVKYQHPVFGFNSRLDSLQAVVLSAKLKHLARWNQMRRDQADFYTEQLAGLEEIKLPVVSKGNVPVWHLYVIQIENRDHVMQALLELGVQTGIHYPTPIHLMGMYEHLGYKRGAFPVAEESSARALSLPIYPGLTQGEQLRVVRSIKQVLAKK